MPFMSPGPSCRPAFCTAASSVSRGQCARLRGPGGTQDGHGSQATRLPPTPQGVQSRAVHTVRRDLRKGPAPSDPSKSFPRLSLPPRSARSPGRAWEELGQLATRPTPCSLGRAAPPGPLLHLIFP